KSTLLMLLYANPDYYPPTINAARLLREYFSVHILCRNMEKLVARWPADVSIDRIGPYASERDKEGAGPLEKFREYVRFVLAVKHTVSSLKPQVIYAYDPHALAAVSLVAKKRPRSCPI